MNMMDIQAFLEYFHRTDALSREMGIHVRSLSAEGAEAEMEISEHEKNYMGMLHGGAFFTIADVVAGLCVSYYGEQCVTLSSNLNYLKAATSGKIIARSSLSRRGRKICVCEIRIVSEEEVLLCTGTFTMYMTGIPIKF